LSGLNFDIAPGPAREGASAMSPHPAVTRVSHRADHVAWVLFTVSEQAVCGFRQFRKIALSLDAVLDCTNADVGNPVVCLCLAW
jgi:hypothetical protein